MLLVDLLLLTVARAPKCLLRLHTRYEAETTNGHVTSVEIVRMFQHLNAYLNILACSALGPNIRRAFQELCKFNHNQ